MHLTPKQIRNATALVVSVFFISAVFGVSFAFASLTFTGTNIAGDMGTVVDASGTIAIGTSSASSITIGHPGITITIPGTLTVTGSTTTLQNLVVTGTCTGCGSGGSSIPGALYDLLYSNGNGTAGVDTGRATYNASSGVLAVPEAETGDGVHAGQVSLGTGTEWGVTSGTASWAGLPSGQTGLVAHLPSAPCSGLLNFTNTTGDMTSACLPAATTSAANSVVETNSSGLIDPSFFATTTSSGSSGFVMTGVAASHNPAANTDYYYGKIYVAPVTGATASRLAALEVPRNCTLTKVIYYVEATVIDTATDTATYYITTGGSGGTTGSNITDTAASIAYNTYAQSVSVTASDTLTAGENLIVHFKTPASFTTSPTGVYNAVDLYCQ